MARHTGGARYMDYTHQMDEEPGPSGYSPDGGYSPYEREYDPPDRPPRREKSSTERSMSRSRERLDRRERSQEKKLERENRSMERNLERGDRSMERNLERGNRSMERNLERGDRSMERNLERGNRSMEMSLDRRDRSLERNLDRGDRSLELSIEHGLDPRDRSLEQQGIENGLDRRNRRGRSYDDHLDRRDHSRDSSIDRRERRHRDRHDYDDRSIDRTSRSMDRLDRRERSIERLDRNHRSSSGDNLSRNYHDQVYLHPGSGPPRAPSDRAESEFTVRNETLRGRTALDEEEERRAASRAASEIYASTRFPRPHSQMSQYTYRSGRAGSDILSVKTKTTANGKLVMETMTAPHPCCPNTRACCCLMILLNLAILLITLGFVVVLQLYEPPFVWYVGLSMLIFGFLVLFGSMIYCVFVCREVEKLRPPPGELYWTNHWSKTVKVPEIHYSNQQTRPSDYRGSEFSFKTDQTAPSRITADNNTASSLTRY